MAFEIENKRFNVNTEGVFIFSESFTQSCIGFSKFDFHYKPYTDHKIQHISLDMSTTSSDNNLAVSVSAQFHNGGNKKIHSDSFVNVVAMAQTGAKDSDILLTNLEGISRGNDKIITVPTSSKKNEAVFLSGFNYSYGKKDHQVNEISALLSTQAINENQVQIKGDAIMKNTHGDSGDGTLAAGYTNAVDTSQLYCLHDLGSFQYPKTTHVVPNFKPPEGYDWEQLQIVVTDFKAAFPKGDHNINTLSTGVDTWTAKVEKDGSVTLTLRNPCTLMFNQTGIMEQQDNAKSYVMLAALAPALS